MSSNSPIWMLADACEVVPVPADPVLARCIAGWWERPRTFGCDHAKAARVWFVVWPQPEALCGTCALRIHALEKRCVYCLQDVETDDDGHTIVHESRGFVEVMSKAHHRCAEEAAR
jgi:hypothetical protein